VCGRGHLVFELRDEYPCNIKGRADRTQAIRAIFQPELVGPVSHSSNRSNQSRVIIFWPPWEYAEAGAVAALVAVGVTDAEAAELKIALGLWDF
jgi:hypothetical protein